MIDNIISVQKVVDLQNKLIIDVRCKREFDRGHFPDAINIPLFNNKEYEELGLLYRKEGEDVAYDKGHIFVKKRSKKILRRISELDSKNLILYCARGGMRSSGMQSLISKSRCGSKVITSGYKSIRNHFLNVLNQKKNLIILAGRTGTGKTEILHRMNKMGHQTIDLEKLAMHKGSAFGDLGITTNITQQQFENSLALEWNKIDNSRPVFIESESRKIGKVVIPNSFFDLMSSSLYIKIDMDIKRRINNLLRDYGHFSFNDLADRTKKISKKLGGLNTTDALNLLSKNDLYSFTELLLKKYYDKMYDTAYNKRYSEKILLQITNESNENIIYKVLNSL